MSLEGHTLQLNNPKEPESSDYPECRAAPTKAKHMRWNSMAIPKSYLSKLSLVLMKKSNFCFAYSITSE